MISLTCSMHRMVSIHASYDSSDFDSVGEFAGDAFASAEIEGRTGLVSIGRLELWSTPPERRRSFCEKLELKPGYGRLGRLGRLG